MHFVRVAAACVLVLAFMGTAQATSLLPLATAADESGFGTLYASLASPYTGSGYNGTLYSRVYVDALPASQVTFVYDLQVNLALTQVENLNIIPVVPLEYDLQIGEILAGINGYVTSETTKIPTSADAINNVYPTADQLLYAWTGNKIPTGGRATLFVQTSGAVDVGQVSGTVQDGGTSHVDVLAPVDDPANPDLNVPEPASLVLLALGAFFIRRRR
jgi:LEA14-like dessication related protein